MGQALSTIGTQFTTVAMAWQMYELTDSALQVGLLGLARGIPQVGLLLVGGLLADALDRRKLLMLTNVGMLAVAAALVALSIAGAITPFVLYVGSAFLALFTSIDNPSRQALVPNLVSREHLANALALNITQRQMGMIAGPSIAGLVPGRPEPAPLRRRGGLASGDADRPAAHQLRGPGDRRQERDDAERRP